MSRLMQEVIPFNRPHRLTVQSLSDERCEVALPFRRRNLNHVGTMHACPWPLPRNMPLACACSVPLVCGHVRLVMANMEISYSRRGDSRCVAEAELPSEMLQHVQTQLNDHGRCAFELHAVVRDADDEVVAEAQITWHLKAL